MYISSILQLLIIFTCGLLQKNDAGSVGQNGDKNTDTGDGSGSKAFSCAGKVIGGYYADVQENCQMFHVCTIGENGEIRDIVFRCLNGTVFDQETRVCEREEEVNCPIAESFYYLNNDLYGPGIIPETVGALKHAQGQTERQKLQDKQTETKFMCRGKSQATFYVEPMSNCERFHLCIPQPNNREMIQTFVCADEGHKFDPNTKMCSRREATSCLEENQSSNIGIREAELFSVYLLKLCPLYAKGTLMIDSLSGCEQYFQCPVDQNSKSIAMRRCPAGQLFSQDLQKCIHAEEVSCARDLYSQLKLFHLKTSGKLKNTSYKNIEMKSSSKSKSLVNVNTIQGGPPLLRRVRALTFEDRNPQREVASGSLTNVAGIFSDHSSVIESQSPGNVVEGKVDSPKFSLKYDSIHGQPSQPPNRLDIIYQQEKAVPVQPETSSETNKTTLNEATIEVTKIASPDNKTEVTITSIVPKLVRHNGNGQNTKIGDTQGQTPRPTIISNGKTKITLIGSGDIPSETKTEGATDISEEKHKTDASERNLTDADTLTTSAKETDTTTAAVTDPSASETTDFAAEITETPEIKTTILTTTVPTTTTTSTLPPTTTTTTTTTTTVTTTSTTSTTSAEPESSKEEKVETNFTCKDKELEQFYPDIEKDCKLFHYCSPGFSENEVLDLTFVCSNDTRFDVVTNKCQDMNTVVCGQKAPKTTTPATTTTTTSTAAPETTTTTTATTPATSTTVSTPNTEALTTAVHTSTLSSTIIAPTTTRMPTASETEEKTALPVTAFVSEGSETSVPPTPAEETPTKVTELKAISKVTAVVTEDEKDGTTLTVTLPESEIPTTSTTLNELKTDKLESSLSEATGSITPDLTVDTNRINGDSTSSQVEAKETTSEAKVIDSSLPSTISGNELATEVTHLESATSDNTS